MATVEHVVVLPLSRDQQPGRNLDPGAQGHAAVRLLDHVEPDDDAVRASRVPDPLSLSAVRYDVEHHPVEQFGRVQPALRFLHPFLRETLSGPDFRTSQHGPSPDRPVAAHQHLAYVAQLTLGDAKRKRSQGVGTRDRILYLHKRIAGIEVVLTQRRYALVKLSL